MTDKDKKYFFEKISTLRKGLQMLEEELGELAPPLPTKRKNLWREHFINKYELGIRSRPVHTKSKKKQQLN